MTLAGIVTHKINRVSVALVTVVTTVVLAVSGLSPVGAQAAGTYQCGTYGGGNYNQTDCTDGTSTGSGNTGSTSTGSSSSTGSTSSSSSASSSAILLNDFSEYTSTTGKSLDFKKGDVFNFNLKDEKHTITVKSFDKNTLVVTVASTPTDVSVAYGQTVNYDVDQDGTADIAITYNSISTDGATATGVYKALASAVHPTPTQNAGSSSNSSTGGTTASEQSSTNMWWVWLIPIVIGLALLIWAIAAAKKRKAAAKSGGANFNQF